MSQNSIPYRTTLMEPMEKSRLFFITGRGRSGTWLLKTILDAHPQISVTPESLFCVLLARRYRGRLDWNRRQIEQFCRDVAREQKVPAWWKLSYQEMRSYLQSQKAHGKLRSFADACRSIHDLYASKSGKAVEWIGGKNPEYSFFHSQLMNLFAEARFIHMVRDPRDTILSFLKVRFDLNDPVSLAYRWQAYNASALRFQQQHPERILIVRFEDLITDQKRELNRIMEFLNLPYDDSMLIYYKKASSVFSFNKKITEPPSRERVYSWKLSPALPDAVNRITASGISAFGYESGDTLSPLTTGDQLSIMKGWLTTALERQVFTLPTFLSLPLLAIYRRATGTLQEADHSR